MIDVRLASKGFARFAREAFADPLLWASFCCFWLWPWLLSNSVRRSVAQPAPDPAWFWTFCWLPLFLALAVSLLGFAWLEHSFGVVAPRRARIAGAAASMSAAAACALVFCLSDPYPSVSWGIVSGVWMLLGGFGLALMCAEWGCAFADIGARRTLFAGAASTVASVAAMCAVAALPLEASYAFIVVVPVASVACMAARARRHRLGKRPPSAASFGAEGANSSSSRDASLVAPRTPWKLSVTVFVWACAFGAVMAVVDATGLWAQAAVPAYVVGALLILALALWLRVDFNHLLYKAGFVIMASGLLVMLLSPALQTCGYFVFNVGYRFVELLVWGLCAHLALTRKLSASWIVSVNVGVWTLGRFLGFLGTMALLGVSQESAEGMPPSAAGLGSGMAGDVLLVCLFVLLMTSLFISSRGNLAEGWGMERVDDGAESARLVELSCEGLAAEGGLSPREAEVLVLMASGCTRGDIAQRLVISNETVKTHMRHVYRKLGVGSREELMERVERGIDPSRGA